jgi:hypothetical protein
VRGRNLDDAIITRFKRISPIAGLTDQLTFEDINTFLEGMDMRIQAAAGIELTDAKLLVDRTHLTIHNGPAAKPFAQGGEGSGDFKGFLLSRADDVSGRH